MAFLKRMTISELIYKTIERSYEQLVSDGYIRQQPGETPDCVKLFKNFLNSKSNYLQCLKYLTQINQRKIIGGITPKSSQID